MSDATPLGAQMISRIEELEQRPGLAPKAVVVGAGYAGIELAATVAERLPTASVQVISSGQPCTFLAAHLLTQVAPRMACGLGRWLLPGAALHLRAPSPLPGCASRA